MKFIAIIPARYASTRFPGKPLAILGGKPVIQRVYEQVAGVLDAAVVATDDRRIYEAVVAFGGRAEMTSPEHRSGTDRCWEAYCRQGEAYDAVVNVQGDEPFIRPEQLEAVCRCFDDPATDIATLVKPFAAEDGLAALENPNSPKVVLDEVAGVLAGINRRLGTDIIFKASFDKANRTSVASFRGPGIDRGLRMLADVRAKWGLRLLTDIHEAWQAAPAGEVVDVLQIPAFLCRQTDLLTAAARTGRTVNIKKAQFLSGEDMRYPYEKAREAGAGEIWLTERGNIYGYNNLVVDFRNIADMLKIAPTVVMDCTHSVQRPGAAGGKTGGNREFVPAMAQAARAFGANGFFFEVHPDPDRALSDGPNMLYLKDLEQVIKSLL